MFPAVTLILAEATSIVDAAIAKARQLDVNVSLPVCDENGHLFKRMDGERIGIMPITPFLGDQKFDPETTRIMGVAFEMARAAVKRDWGGLYASHIIAKRIIELAKDGERNSDLLCEAALKKLAEHFYTD
jgi:hypothetical protein